MHFKPKAGASYLLLLVSSLGIPLLHGYLAAGAIERTRMATEFLPAHFLFWRWLGELAWFNPVIVAAFYLFSLGHEQLGRAPTLFGLATMQLIFATFYGLYCAFLLSHLLLDRVG
ncbi:MAG: hypothetical protein ACK4UN_11195 [Limisphaerales bacterium]